MKTALLTLLLALPVLACAQNFENSKYDEQGRLVATFSGEDKQNYRFITYHENGIRNEAGAYRDGVKHGVWKSWDENGQLVAKGRYREGVKTGKWTILSREEHQMFQIDFEKDHVKTACRKDMHGHVLAQR